MLSNKNKAEIKRFAQQNEKSILKVNVGKDLIYKNVVEMINKAFNTRELVKICCLKSSTAQKSKNELIIDLTSLLNCEVVQVIGNSILLYKPNDKISNRIVLSK